MVDQPKQSLLTGPCRGGGGGGGGGGARADPGFEVRGGAKAKIDWITLKTGGGGGGGLLHTSGAIIIIHYHTGSTVGQGHVKV